MKSKLLFAAFTLLGTAVTACGNSSGPRNSPTTSSSASSSPAATATPTPAPTPPPLAAPVLVQVENLDAARPQSGLSYAQIVYEYATEGGISRFTAIYFQLPSGQIGPVRSARIVTVKLLEAYQGTLFYSGATHYVSSLLAASGGRQYDESTARGDLYRIDSRYAPHNLYTDGPHLASFLASIGQHFVTYRLWTRTPLSALPAGGTPVSRFSVPISPSEQPIFTYVPAYGAYERTEPETGLLVDADHGSPWVSETVAILQVSVTRGPEIEDSNGNYGLDFGIAGTGVGQLAVGGRLYPITWTQTPLGTPQFTLANGAPAPVTTGQVLIELVGLGQAVTPR